MKWEYIGSCSAELVAIKCPKRDPPIVGWVDIRSQPVAYIFSLLRPTLRFGHHLLHITKKKNAAGMATSFLRRGACATPLSVERLLCNIHTVGFLHRYAHQYDSGKMAIVT